MPTGKTITDAQRRFVLKLFCETKMTKVEIASTSMLSKRTISDVIDDAARSYYRMTKPTSLDYLPDPP